MLTIIRTIRDDAEWRVIAGIITSLLVAAGASLYLGGFAALVALVAGVGFGCFVQAIFLHMQRRGT